MTDKRLFAEYCEKFGVTLSDDAAELLDGFSDFVLEQNKLFNLTAITDSTAFTEKHLIDSVAAVPFIKKDASLCDVGSGAGFPAVPIAALRRDVKVTALDSTSKKTAFISAAAKKFNIENLSVISARAEECTHERETFDVVTARAVASLGILCEIALPLVRVGGIFIAYKTDSEENVSESSVSLLGGKLKQTFSYSLPSGDRRCLYIFKKSHHTDPDYPRQYGKIKKAPLF